MKYLLCVLSFALCSLSASAQLVPKLTTEYDAILERIQYELDRSVDPRTDQLPLDIGRREFEFTSRLPAHPHGIAQKGSSPLGIDWLPVGPTDQPGRVRAFAIDVSNKMNFLAATASGGVWRSIDAGASWVKVTPANEMQIISSIAQDPRPGKTATWYYGTSELLSTTNRRHTTNIRTHGYGNGIYRSTDNGATWAVLPSTQTRPGYQAPIAFTGVWEIVVDHTAQNDILYAACGGGIMRSTNGGTDWQMVLGDTNEYCFNADIVIAKNGTLYASLSSVFNGKPSPKQGIWRSTNGTDWVQIDDDKMPPLFRRCKLAVAPSDNNVLYAFSEWPNSWINPDGSFNSTARLLRFANNEWKEYQLPDGGNYFTLTGYCMGLAVHPTDPNVVFFAGTDAYRSTEDGSSFAWLGGYDTETQSWTMHPDVHDLLFDPHDPTMLFAATDGGICSTAELEATKPVWAEYFGGMETSQVYDAKLDPKTPGNPFIVAGLQDNNSYATLDPSLLWEITSGGDGMTTGVIDGERFFTTSQQGGYIIFLGYNTGTLNYYGYGRPEAGIKRFTFYTRYLIDPVAQNIVYAPEWNNLWRYTDLDGIRAISFVDNQNGWELFENVGSLIGNNNSISALAASPQTGSIYLGTANGKLYRIPNGDITALPVSLSNTAFPPNAFLAHIEVDPKNEQHLIVVFSNYNIQSVFRTTDGGSTWTPISGNLESEPEGAGAGPSIRCVRMLHTPSGIVYFAGTTSGLFSTDVIAGAQTQWKREGATTIGNLIVENIDVRESDGWVICATQGGGVFAGTSTGADVRTANGPRQLIVHQNYPNPMRESSEIRFSLAADSKVTVEIFDVRGSRLSTITDKSYAKGDHWLTLSPALENGVYYYRFTAGKEIVTKMFRIAN